MTIDEIEVIYARLNQEWPTAIKDLHLSNKSLYNLISFRKTLENKHFTIQETVATIMRSHGAEENENGGLQVPKDNIADTNKDLMDLAHQSEEISYELIAVREQDSVPATLMDILYDFIVIE